MKESVESYLSGDAMYLKKCTDLANRLSPAFNTETGIPLGNVNLATVRADAM